MEKKEINPIIEFILANTDKADLEKALKNYNLQMIINPHKDQIKQVYFNGDGLKMEAEMNVLFDDYLTYDQSMEAQGYELEARSAAKSQGKTSDEYLAASKKIKSFEKKLDSIWDLYDSVQSKNNKSD